MAERAAEKTEPIFRRNSTGSFGIQLRDTKILPHYLLRSEGSCHDLCKYGCKRDAETTMKKSSPRTSLSNPNGLTDHPADNFDLQKKKKSFGTMKPPLDSTSRITNQVTRKEISSTSKKVVSATNPSHSNQRPWKIPAVSVRVTKVPHWCYSDCPTAHVTSRRRFSEIIIPKDFELNPPSGSGKKITETKVVNEIGNTKVGKKKVPVPPAAGSSSTKSSSAAGSSSTKSSSAAGSSSTKSSSVAGSSSTKSPSVAGSSSTKSLPKRVVKTQNGLTKATTKQVRDQSVLEKTLYVIEPEAESQSTGMVKTKSSLYQSLSDKDKTSQNEMLLRKGKQIDIQSTEVSPRRFELRHVEVLPKDQSEKTDATEVILRKIDIEANDKLNEDENKNSELNLRHQDVEENKDSQNSINNVIEETASKLGKTRKSRVMALVGAFETVISLQDTKKVQKTRK